MPQLIFKGVVSYQPNIVLSAQEVINNYLQGVVLTYKNQTIPTNAINYYIQSAQDYVERILNIRINRQLMEETQDLSFEDWRNWGFLSANYPVVCFKSLDGYLGSSKITTYPHTWISTVKPSDSKTLPSRIVRLIPNGSSGITYNYNSVILFDSYYNYLYGNMSNNRQMPNYWLLKYVTGWEPGKIPSELVSLIGKLAAVQMLVSVGEIQFSLIGVSSQSLSLDGLSQTLSTVAGNQHPFSARVKSLNDQIQSEFKLLSSYYTQPSLTVM